MGRSKVLERRAEVVIYFPLWLAHQKQPGRCGAIPNLPRRAISRRWRNYSNASLSLSFVLVVSPTVCLLVFHLCLFDRRRCMKGWRVTLNAKQIERFLAEQLGYRYEVGHHWEYRKRIFTYSYLFLPFSIHGPLCLVMIVVLDHAHRSVSSIFASWIYSPLNLSLPPQESCFLLISSFWKLTGNLNCRILDFRSTQTKECRFMIRNFGDSINH